MYLRILRNYTTGKICKTGCKLVFSITWRISPFSRTVISSGGRSLNLNNYHDKRRQIPKNKPTHS